MLDLTRLISRSGIAALSGVDRVELAYLNHLLTYGAPVFFLVRTGKGYRLLDRAGGQAIRNRIMGHTPWGPRNIWSLFSPRISPARQRAEADLRRLSVAASTRPGLTRMLRRRVGDGLLYLNIGLSNLGARNLAAIRAVPRSDIAVFIHDTIPLDHPEFQTSSGVERFERRFAAVNRYANTVIYNSEYSRQSAEKHFQEPVPRPVVAALAHDPVSPGDLPPAFRGGQPYFVCIGTIEPRKNHLFLLDLWEEMARNHDIASLPHLHIIGRRGWVDQGVISRLDGSVLRNRLIFEHGDIDDATLAAILRHAHGLVFPSLAEGFGLPLIEAAHQNIPVLCCNLAVYSEFLGDTPIYLNAHDRYAWEKEILRLAKMKKSDVDEEAGNRRITELPTWSSHFHKVFRQL